MFLGYDPVAQRCVPFAYAHPVLAARAGLPMVGRVAHWPAELVALIAATVRA